MVIDHDDRAIGILTERDMIRLAAAGSDASTAKVSEWMTADPDTIGPDVEARAAFASLAEHGYRHIPVVDGRERQKLVGIVSMRDLMRVAMIQPADAQAHEVPKGLEGVVVADTTVGDVRGLEGFYHYRQYSAVDLAKTRPLEDVWYLLFKGRLPATLAERDAFAADIRAPPRDPDRGRRRAPRDRARRRDVRPARRAAHRASRSSARRSASARRTTSTTTTLRDNAMSTCAVVPTLICALWRLRQGLEPIAPHADLGYAANYLYMMQGEVPDRRARGRGREVPHLHDRPRLQRVDVHRARHHVDRRRPRRRGRRRRSARCRVRCTAARRAARSRCSTRSAPPTAPSRGCAPRSSAATGSWASVTACTRPTTRAR